MKKRPSLNPKKKSKREYPKFLSLNKYLIIFGCLIFVSVCGYIIITNSDGSQPNIESPTDDTGVQASTSYQISVIDNSTGGDITNNTVLMENINKTDVINEIIHAANNGTPMITLGNGSEPRIMIVAGVHGAELPPQIAVTRLINNLKDEKINGTLYIVPFAIPHQTATLQRLDNGTDPDRVAHISGTPLDIISNTSINNQVTMLVDFHSAQPNDVPGKNCIIYDSENLQSLKLARFISNKTKSPLVKVGNYSGVLSTVSNRKGITSVVCEVLSPHSKVEPGSVELSYAYMMAFLEYAGVYVDPTIKYNIKPNETIKP
ncbi:MAG: succinylglutamate desuccinylase/aspartoacylase family protein [Methanobacteriaceae archaeon]|nr:succinylglutamate desuccinylase/aspartoacylase family protein [Methanobacteriaceae archaeon]